MTSEEYYGNLRVFKSFCGKSEATFQQNIGKLDTSISVCRVQLQFYKRKKQPML